MPIVFPSEFTSTKFDYLIVGGGNAGLTLGVRLSEDPNITVGIIEAGTHEVDVPEITIPGLMASTINNPKYDWAFYSTPQRHADGQALLQPRGKGLGGSTLINFLGLSRANKDEYDLIEKLGNPGWNWDSLLGYMKKSENTILTNSDPPFHGSEECKAYGQHVYDFNGQNGPVYKTFPTFRSDVQKKVIETYKNLGVSPNPDGNNGSNIGAVTLLTSVDPRSMTRSSAFTAYFKPNEGRKNLLVLTNAQVVKILLKPTEDGLQKAIGVDLVVLDDGMGTKEGQHILTVQNVARDIIVSAGSFQSPQLLELSGIGNADILSEHGIPCRVPLPGVGENLQDHVCVRTFAEINKDCETADELAIWEVLKSQELSIRNSSEKKGHLTSIFSSLYTFLPSSRIMDSENVNEWIERAIIQQDQQRAVDRGYERQREVLRKWIVDDKQAQIEIINYAGHQGATGLKPVPGKRYNTFTAVLMHPLSRGTVHISSNDPLAPPEINPNYLSNESDLEVLVKGLKFMLNLYSTPPFEQLVKELVLPPPPAMESEKNLKKWVKKSITHVYHPVGTCAMMPREDGGVVDSKLKVYGTSNLRVVSMISSS
ncbi:hypothetical protein D9757_012265 [Collybiopsis confluens]|uniref:Glucose-methanol-choline oxidoreductase N-terminal domain-containing protein n=1 Tax=Collybiopsis confluens TaxID=2823264 RepID=A0A8H5G5N6_9AGAR|nr:hypothetical protein D9757_012265 [Collybiopsis confluens]